MQPGRPPQHLPARGTSRLESLLRRRKNRRRANKSSALARKVSDPATRRRLLYGLLAFVGLLASGAAVSGGVLLLHRFLTRSAHFALREVRLPVLRHVQPDGLRARTGVSIGENLFAVDLAEVEARLRREPWLDSVRVHRELPAAIAVEAHEREAACAVALGAIYLADASGTVFKRANPDEAAAWPLVTGVPRAGYVHDREAARALVRQALAALAAWRAKDRPPIGEVHVDPGAGVTLYTKAGGLAVRVGRGDERALGDRLARVDAVLRALRSTGERAQTIYADQPHHPERVTVHLKPSGEGT